MAHATKVTKGSYVSSVAARPHFLVRPGPQPSRVAEFARMLAWIVESWFRPADTCAGATQQPARERRAT